MILTELKIHQLRNIKTAHLFLNPRFNIICGANGSGKTSLLEALYVLSCGHSFRSREISPIISNQYDSLTVFARSQDESTISIQKSLSEPSLIKLNNQFCSSTSQLAYALPCQVFYSDVFQIIDAGPSVRRSVLDWGLFHVKPEYLSLWKSYKHVLKQRNVLLKKNAPFDHFIPWDDQLCHYAERLDNLRREYFLQWQIQFAKVLEELTSTRCRIEYAKGWDKKNTGKPLKEVLAEQFISDKQKTYTQYGAHQADILIESDDVKAKHVLSRGQQKIILIALKLAQGLLLQKECLYLFDDLPAELDEGHQHALLKFLEGLAGQYVMTCLSNTDLVSHLSQGLFNHLSLKDGVLSSI
ncbi:MAG TPA: DNA replication/repair protein RecF [Legionella sp.]|nr:DNA replication/repair protein RecF [Legionella sp.]